jgi:hypothetical protein
LKDARVWQMQRGLTRGRQRERGRGFLEQEGIEERGKKKKKTDLTRSPVQWHIISLSPLRCRSFLSVLKEHGEVGRGRREAILSLGRIGLFVFLSFFVLLEPRRKKARKPGQTGGLWGKATAGRAPHSPRKVIFNKKTNTPKTKYR